MPELLLLVAVLAGVGAIVLAPMWQRGAAESPVVEGAEALELRYRLAIEAVHDVEIDRRAGSLDEAGYLAQRAEAEERAAEALVELETAHHDPAPPVAIRPAGRAAVILATAVVALVAVGYLVPAPLSLANPMVINQPLADAQRREAERQATMRRLLTALAATPRDAGVLSQLADAYLAGRTRDDLSRAAVALLAVISLDPNDVSAYRRLITAYINAGDWTDAASATDSLAKLASASTSTSVDVAFFRGLIALRGPGDRATALREFDRFLALAPNDGRAAMIRALRVEAAATPAPTP